MYQNYSLSQNRVSMSFSGWIWFFFWFGKWAMTTLFFLFLPFLVIVNPGLSAYKKLFQRSQRSKRITDRCCTAMHVVSGAIVLLILKSCSDIKILNYPFLITGSIRYGKWSFLRIDSKEKLSKEKVSLLLWGQYV